MGFTKERLLVEAKPGRHEEGLHWQSQIHETGGSVE
jgi:hypothetical protein